MNNYTTSHGVHRWDHCSQFASSTPKAIISVWDDTSGARLGTKMVLQSCHSLSESGTNHMRLLTHFWFFILIQTDLLIESCVKWFYLGMSVYDDALHFIMIYRKSTGWEELSYVFWEVGALGVHIVPEKKSYKKWSKGDTLPNFYCIFESWACLSYLKIKPK